MAEKRITPKLPEDAQKSEKAAAGVERTARKAVKATKAVRATKAVKATKAIKATKAMRAW